MAKARTTKNEPVTTATDLTTKKSSQPATVADGEIARRAYDLYLARGCEHGHDVEDWLQAEHELNGAVHSTALA